MGKTSMWKRLLAVVLVLAMVFSTQTMSVFAGVVGAEIVPKQQRDVDENSNTNTGGTTNLNALLTSAEFGTDTVHVGTTYTISLAFEETMTDQFAEGETLEYTFPSGFVPEASASGTFYLEVTDNNTGNTVNVGASYRIEGQKLLVTVDTADPNYGMYTRAADAAFSLDIRMTVTEDAQTGEVVFGDKVKKDVTVSNESGLTVTKEGAYDKTNGKFNYTVRVTSTGTNNNVTITDTIEGTLLTYNKDLVVSSNKGSSEVGGSVTSKNDNGFTYVEASMVDGEVLTLQYSASIDYSQLTGSKFTAEQTGNGVKVTSDEDEDGDEASKDFNNETAYDLISKTHTNVDSTDEENQIITWEIVLNEDCLVSVAGQTVTDTIAASSRNIMKYTGNGITVRRYDAAGAQVGSDENISWSELGVNPASAYSWSWTIPETDTETYKYVITYNTVVDGSGLWSGNASVGNNASFGGDSDGDSVGVEPGSDFEVTKTHTAANGNERWVDWKIDVTVPASGYSTFRLEDTLRTIWADINGTSTVICHRLVADTLKVEGLVPGETYDTTFSYVTDHPVVEDYNLSGFTMTFYKDAGKTQTGLQETVAERVITVTFRTEYPSGWVQTEKHRNTVTVYNDQGNKTAYDEFTLSSTQVEKLIRTTSSASDGMPTITYLVGIGGVSGEPVVIEDTFDRELFELYDVHNNNELYLAVGFNSWELYGGNINNGTVSYEYTETGLKFTLPSPLRKYEPGMYYPWYGFSYTLKVKDQDALDKIEAAARESADGKATYTNTATSNGASDSVDWEYTYKPVEKSITTKPSANNNYTVTFTLKVNEGGDTLNNGNKLELTDYMTGLQYVYGSMQVTIGGEDRENYPFTLNTEGTSSTIVWEIPDSTPVTITYQAKVQGTGSVSYSNTATLMGKYSSGTGDQQVTIDYNGQGTGNVYNVEIVKVDADDPNTVLSGATFKLQCYEGDPATSNPGSLTGANETQYDPEYTTGSDGTVTIISDQQGNGWALWPGILY